MIPPKHAIPVLPTSNPARRSAPSPAWRCGIAAVAFLVALATPVANVARADVPATRPAAADVQTVQAADLPFNMRGATGQLAEHLKPFDLKPEAFAYKMRLAEEEEALRFYQVSFPSQVQTPWPENNVVPSELYLPKNAQGKVPGVVVLDILHGSGIIARSLARGLAERGAAALYIQMPTYADRRPKGNAHVKYYGEKPERTLESFRQTVLDVRRAKAILAGRPEVDPQRLGLTGVSLGGIMTCLAAGVDGEFDKVVPILAGGDVATITFHAREARQMRAAAQAAGLDRDGMAKLLAPVEPLTFASRIRPVTCLMINAANDEVIPKACTEAIRDAIGGPQILWAPAGHYSAMVYLPTIRSRAIDFILGKKVEGLTP